jgi:Protein of unknown function (DUF4238)
MYDFAILGVVLGAESVLPDPRRHHYVPKFLLAGFTLSGSPDDGLWAHSVTEPRDPHRATPSAAGFERDFYRVGAGDDPAAVERLLGDFETKLPVTVVEAALAELVGAGRAVEIEPGRYARGDSRLDVVTSLHARLSCSPTILRASSRMSRSTSATSRYTPM